MRKSIKLAISAFTGAIIGVGITRKISGKKYKRIEELSDKHLKLFFMTNQWIKVKQEGKNLAEYLGKLGFQKIAIYGMSYVGRTLLEELRETEIEVAYGIDKKMDEKPANIEVFTAGDYLEEVDAVIVTAITYFDEIEDELSEKLNCPIVSLEDVILYEDYMGE